MRRVFPLLLALAVSTAVVPRTQAEDSPSVQEFHELRQAVQQQGKQIELLAEQLGKLTRVIESQRGVESAPKTTETAPAPAPVSSAESKPPPEAAAETAKAESVPKAEAALGPKHVVAKGETLTSIAKHYNISIADLKSANKIDNERKLQIGQILSVPTAKTPESTDKKENP